LQALINMAVNLKLMPAKGMTLPFVSYGGSSLTAVAIGMGMLLALTRKRPDTVAQSRPRIVFDAHAVA
jgi:cell division protein FtsW